MFSPAAQIVPQSGGSGYSRWDESRVISRDLIQKSRRMPALHRTKGWRGASDARPGARRGTVFSRTKSAQARVLVPLKATNADLFPGFNSKELAECRRFTRDERRAGRVGREAGGEAGDGSLENEKRTGKSACATQGENRKSRQDVGFLRDSCFSEFLAWDRT